MRDFNETNATPSVLAELASCTNPRLRQVMESVVRHLHAIAREVEITPQEWELAIRFLTRTGQMCSPVRQEFILLSDTLGVSMLVDAIAHRQPGKVTESTVLGPFYVAGAPALRLGETISHTEGGAPTYVEGRVLAQDGAPIAGASLDVWQTSHDGFYDVQQPVAQPEKNLRGLFRTDAAGRFYFCTVRPASYPIPTDGPVGELLSALGRHPYRPAHIHFIVSAPGYEAVTTQLFVDTDKYLDSDAVFAVKQSLIASFERVDDATEARRIGLPSPFWRVRHEFRLQAARERGRDHQLLQPTSTSDISK